MDLSDLFSALDDAHLDDGTRESQRGLVLLLIRVDAQ
jgi:hypothetical protein